MEGTTKHVVEATLGAAPCSCSGRAVLTTRSKGDIIIIEAADSDDESCFSNTCNIFSDEETSKIQQMTNNGEHSALENMLTPVLFQFFTSLRDATLATCVRKGIQVTSVGITLPRRWPQAAAALFMEVSSRTFLEHDRHINISPDDIHWPNDTQALCHYILKNRPEMLQKHGSDGFPVLLADRGARDLNISMSWVQLGSNNAAMILDMEELSGAIGGGGRQDQLALGAAYAAENALSAKEFIENGATVGVQVKKVTAGDWNNQALILCHKYSGYDRELDIDQGDELKLICKSLPTLDLQDEYMDLERAYDMHTLGIFNRGKAEFRAMFCTDGEDSRPKLLLRTNRCPDRGRPGGQRRRSYRSITLSLTFDRPSGCALVVQEDAESIPPSQASVDTPGLDHDFLEW